MLFVCALLSFLSALRLSLGAINQEISQTIDASTAIVRLSAEIKATDVGSRYEVIFPTSWANHMAFFTATQKGKVLQSEPPVSEKNKTSIFVNIEGSSSSANFKIQAVFTDILTPYPAEITQSENQLVALDTSHYFLSPYPTVSQKTVIKLASGTVESFTQLTPSVLRGSTLHLGPYKDVAAHEMSPLRVHFVHNHPFAKIKSVQKEVEVSHWGNIAVEEAYELQHAGARLKGGFSRFDYQMRRNSPTPSFRNLAMTLPAQAHSIYYRDQIGNISTSEMRVSKGGDIELDIQTRFPLFGGWQTQFYIGYSLPTELSLFTSSSNGDTEYSLKCPFFTSFHDVWVEESETKIVLPEGARDVKVILPKSTVSSIEETVSVRYTYLDSVLNGGRPVIIVRGKNLVPEHGTDDIIVKYHFSSQLLIIEPLILVLSFFVLFLVASVVARSTGIAGVTKDSKN